MAHSAGRRMARENHSIHPGRHRLDEHRVWRRRPRRRRRHHAAHRIGRQVLHHLAPLRPPRRSLATRAEAEHDGRGRRRHGQPLHDHVGPELELQRRRLGPAAHRPGRGRSARRRRPVPVRQGRQAGWLPGRRRRRQRRRPGQCGRLPQRGRGDEQHRRRGRLRRQGIGQGRRQALRPRGRVPGRGRGHGRLRGPGRLPRDGQRQGRRRRRPGQLRPGQGTGRQQRLPGEGRRPRRRGRPLRQLPDRGRHRPSTTAAAAGSSS